MLQTTQQIAEKFGVTPYTITHNWIPKGLKHIPGAKKSFLFKNEWVEEFLENQAEICVLQRLNNKQPVELNKITKTIKKNNLKCFVS